MERDTIQAVGLGIPFQHPIAQADLGKIIRFLRQWGASGVVAFFGRGEQSRHIYELIARLVPDIRHLYIDLDVFFQDDVIMRPNGPEHRIFDQKFSCAVLICRPDDYLFSLRTIKLLFRHPMVVALPFLELPPSQPTALALGPRNPIAVNLYPFAGSNRCRPVLVPLLRHFKYVFESHTNHNMSLDARIADRQATDDVINFGESACRLCQPLIDTRFAGSIEVLDYYRSVIFHTHISPSVFQQRPDVSLIQLIRDPRDILNSLYHYLVRCGVPDDFAVFANADKEQALFRMMEGFVYVNRSRTFFMQVPPLRAIAADFVKLRRMANVSIVRFEDIRHKPLTAYQELLSSLGLGQAPLLTIDDATLESYIHLGTFESQSGGKRKDGDDLDQLTGRLRKGAVGDWRYHFTARLVQTIGERIAPELEELGYDVC